MEANVFEHFLFILIVLISIFEVEASGKETLIQSSQLRSSDILAKLMENYNLNEPPSDRPTEVRLGVYINSISINQETTDFTVSMYLRQGWKDPRLSFEKIDTQIVHLRLRNETWKQIWIPDTFIRNEKSSLFHGVTVDNRLLKINRTGHVWYVIKISATLSCPMNFEMFPMDTHVCPIIFESFGYLMDTMFFHQLPSPIEIGSDVMLPKFTIKDINTTDCSQNYTTGAYPCIMFKMSFHRVLGFHLSHTYIPSTVMVILSWGSFWLNPEAATARVIIGLSTIMTTLVMSSRAGSSLPEVSYFKAIDVWINVCILFILLSIIEFVVVNCLGKPTMSEEGATLEQKKGQYTTSGQQASESKKKKVPTATLR